MSGIDFSDFFEALVLGKEDRLSGSPQSYEVDLWGGKIYGALGHPSAPW